MGCQPWLHGLSALVTRVVSLGYTGCQPWLRGLLGCCRMAAMMSGGGGGGGSGAAGTGDAAPPTGPPMGLDNLLQV